MELGGEIASGETIKEFENALRAQALSNREEIEDLLKRFLSNSAEKMRDIAENDPSLKGMGTTFVASMLLDDGGLVTVNIGDSRAYVITPGQIDQITSDHTLTGEALRAGREVSPAFRR